MYILYFNVPASHVEAVKDAVFEAGAGKIGNYSHCSWQILGEGQFMPLSGNKAFIGETGKLERVPEYKVETICEKEHLQDIIEALKRAHPYEAPSYQVVKCENF